MAIDIEAEDLVAFSAARDLPTSPSLAQLRYWHNAGIRCADGQFAFLEAVKIGGSWYTSREAFRKFCDETTAQEGTADGAK